MKNHLKGILAVLAGMLAATLFYPVTALSAESPLTFGGQYQDWGYSLTAVGCGEMRLTVRTNDGRFSRDRQNENATYEVEAFCEEYTGCECVQTSRWAVLPLRYREEPEGDPVKYVPYPSE